VPDANFDMMAALDLVEHVQDPIAMLEKYRRAMIGLCRPD